MLCFVLLYFSSDRVEQCQDSLPKAHCFLTVQVMTSQCSTIDNFSPRVLSALQMHFTILLLPAITLFPYWPLPQSEHVAEQKKKESETPKKLFQKTFVMQPGKKHRSTLPHEFCISELCQARNETRYAFILYVVKTH